jgi:hypothetical protein
VQPENPIEVQTPLEDSVKADRSHYRRPPLAEIDSWELWQAWKRGERGRVLPWIGLLAAFCMVLAGMYAFFFFTTSLTGDTIAQVALTIVLIAFLFAIWRRISPRRDFALAVVALIVAVSGGVFLLWLLLYGLSGWYPSVAIGGTLLLGVSGIAIGLRSLNAIARQGEQAASSEQ